MNSTSDEHDDPRYGHTLRRERVESYKMGRVTQDSAVQNAGDGYTSRYELSKALPDEASTGPLAINLKSEALLKQMADYIVLDFYIDENVGEGMTKHLGMALSRSLSHAKMGDGGLYFRKLVVSDVVPGLWAHSNGVMPDDEVGRVCGRTRMG